MNEKYLDALYRFEELIAEDFAAFTEETEKKGLDIGRIKYADCMMHLAKNLRKELFAEEGKDPEELERYSGTSQGYGRAIRTTPGLSGNGGQSGNGQYSGGQSGRGQSGNGRTGNGQSMRGGSSRSGKSAYSGNDEWSGARDSRGRYSGAEESGFYEKMQKMADMTANHDEREMILRMIERLKHESDQ